MRGANEQEADVREFITTYRTRFTPARASSLSRVIRSFLPFYHSPTDSVTGEYTSGTEHVTERLLSAGKTLIFVGVALVVIGLPSLWGYWMSKKMLGPLA